MEHHQLVLQVTSQREPVLEQLIRALRRPDAHDDRRPRRDAESRSAGTTTTGHDDAAVTLVTVPPRPDAVRGSEDCDSRGPGGGALAVGDQLLDPPADLQMRLDLDPRCLDLGDLPAALQDLGTEDSNDESGTIGIMNEAAGIRPGRTWTSSRRAPERAASAAA